MTIDDLLQEIIDAPESQREYTISIRDDYDRCMAVAKIEWDHVNHSIIFDVN